MQIKSLIRQCLFARRLLPNGRSADEGSPYDDMPPFDIPTLTEHKRGGGRVGSDHYRKSLAMCEDFTGLEEGVERYQLLLLVKRVGRAAGFSSRMIQLLDYYMAFTRQEDWEEGARPIVYQSIARTALDLGVSERQIQKLEQVLFIRGALTWNDSGNHKRYGQRDPETGRILYAFGVDLTPLAYLQAELQQKLDEKQLYDNAWMETKRQISWYRRQICALFAEWSREEVSALRRFEELYAEIAVQIRTHLDLESLRDLLARHKSLHSALMLEMGIGEPTTPQAIQRSRIAEKTGKCSSKSEQKIAHYKYTNHQSFDKSNNGGPSDACFQGSVAASSETTSPRTSLGVDHVKLPMAIQAASERVRQWLPADPDWTDVVEAAYRERMNLGISQDSWADACEVLGRTGAALCLLITDRATERTGDAVRRPAAYFRGMVNRAKAGELRLHSSIFGLIGRVTKNDA